MLPQPEGVFDDQPSYSPDGRRIYFERFTVATNDDAIWSMTSDGNDQRRILGPFPNGFVTDPNMSPDGKTLSFQGWDGSVMGPPPNLEPARGLFTADIDGRHITQIRPYTSDQTIKADWAPERSPDRGDRERELLPSRRLGEHRDDASRWFGLEKYSPIPRPDQTNAFLGSVFA